MAERALIVAYCRSLIAGRYREVFIIDDLPIDDLRLAINDSLLFMPQLYERIGSDLTEAIKARDEIRLGVLRMLKAAVKNLAIEKRVAETELGDDAVATLISREAKRRKEAAALYAEGGRQDLRAKEEAELAVLEAYLPSQMDEEELRRVIRETLASDPGLRGNAGRAVGAVMGRVKGRADGATVKRFVEEALKNAGSKIES